MNSRGCNDLFEDEDGGDLRPLRQVCAPASKVGDLALSLTYNRFRDHPQDGGAVGQSYLSDGQARRFLQKNRTQICWWYPPNFHGHRDSALARTNHCGVAVVDGPKPVGRLRCGFVQEGRADGKKVWIQLQTAHQRAVNGYKNAFHAGFRQRRRLFQRQIALAFRK